MGIQRIRNSRMDVGELVAEEEGKREAFGVCTVPDYDDDATP